MNSPIRHEEQEAMGLIRRQTNFVPPMPHRAEITPLPPYQTTLEVQHTASQEVIVHTSMLDRAKGYQLVITPLAVALGVLAVIVSIAFENSLFSFASFCFFWITFVIAWLAGWLVTAMATPEFVSWYSAKRQWDIVEREQKERWAHYKWQTGRLDHERTRNR